MLIHTKLPAGRNYPQLTQFPDNYSDFLAAFRDGQTVDNNTYLVANVHVQNRTRKRASHYKGTARIQGRVRFWRSWSESQRVKAEIVWLQHTKPGLSQRTIARLFHVS